LLTHFNPGEPQHRAARKRAKKLCMQLNTFSVDQLKARQPLYRELFGSVSSAFIEPDFFCDYGYNIFLGDNFFANHHCVMLDAATITIGDRVLLGPSVHLYTTTHPLDATERASGKQLAAPIVIEDDVWIGGNSVIMPGVTVGKGTVIGAGSVVTRSIAAGEVAAGNPCRKLVICDNDQVPI
jgi:maltose O-acetyltransferase